MMRGGLKGGNWEETGREKTGTGLSGKGGALQRSGPAEGRAGRGLMPRQIVRIITPGTIGEETVLVADAKNFLLAIASDAAGFGFAALDASTGEFLFAWIPGIASAHDELSRLATRELIA